MKIFTAPETGVYLFRYATKDRGISHMDKDQEKELWDELLSDPEFLKAISYEDFKKHHDNVFDIIVQYYSQL